MFIIESVHNMYFSGYSHGCVVWKSHATRACLYLTEEDASKDIEDFGLEQVIIREILE